MFEGKILIIIVLIITNILTLNFIEPSVNYLGKDSDESADYCDVMDNDVPLTDLFINKTHLKWKWKWINWSTISDYSVIIEPGTV